MRDGVEGDLIEAGTWRGGASILMRATLDALGAPDRTVWVADSFQGFPAADEQLAPIDYLAVPVADVRANFARLGYERGVRFVEGFFEETLPALGDERWSLVRLDGDTYEATWMTLESLYPGLSRRRAPDRRRLRRGRGVQAGGRRVPRPPRDRRPDRRVDWTSVRWRRGSDAPLAPARPRRAAPATPARPVERPPQTVHVVSIPSAT